MDEITNTAVIEPSKKEVSAYFALNVEERRALPEATRARIRQHEKRERKKRVLAAMDRDARALDALRARNEYLEKAYAHMSNKDGGLENLIEVSI